MKKIPLIHTRRRTGHARPRADFFRILFLAVFFLIPSLSFADAYEETGPSLYLGLWTKHLNPSKETNENSGLVGLGYQNYILTVFENSYDQTTVFASKRFHTRRFGHEDGGGLFLQGNLYLGMFYGYTHNVPNLAGFTPGVMPTVGVGYRKASLELLYFPTPRGGFFLSFFSMRFGEKRPPMEPLEVLGRSSPE